MTLRKKTIDNSVKNVRKNKNSPSEISHDQKPKTDSNPRNQRKKFSQKNKKFNKNKIAEGFGIPK